MPPVRGDASEDRKPTLAVLLLPPFGATNLRQEICIYDPGARWHLVWPHDAPPVPEDAGPG